MRMRGPFGYKQLTERRKPGIQRPRSWVPRHREHYWFRFGGWWLLVTSAPFRGLSPRALYHRDAGEVVQVCEFTSVESVKMKKVSMGLDATAPLPPLSSESVVFRKFPRLREFLSQTMYEDNTPRQPGRLWLDSDGTAFVVTLFEPSAMVRARFRAATLDDVVQLADVFLSQDAPPWEIDQWARDRVTAKKKK